MIDSWDVKTDRKEINHVHMNSNFIIDNCYDTDTDVPTAAIKPKQRMAAPYSPLHTKSVRKPVLVNHPESSVSEVSERDIEAVIHTANPSDIDTFVSDENIHLDSSKPLMCDNKSSNVNVDILIHTEHANENLIDTGTGHDVNSNAPTDRVDNSWATDIHSDTKRMFVLRIEDGLEMYIKCLLN